MWWEGNNPSKSRMREELRLLALSWAQDNVWGHGAGTWHRLAAWPHTAPACRFIKSERSIILLNFCVSILASNILILVGQSQMLSKVGATTVPPSRGGCRGCVGVPALSSSLLPPSSRLDLD